MSNPEIFRLLWTEKFHYHIDRSPQFVPIQIDMNLVRTLLSYFLEICFNSIVLSTPIQVTSFLWDFLPELFMCFSLHINVNLRNEKM